MLVPETECAGVRTWLTSLAVNPGACGQWGSQVDQAVLGGCGGLPEDGLELTRDPCGIVDSETLVESVRVSLY